MINIQAKQVHPAAFIPTYATEGAACFDLYAAANVEVGPCGGTATVRTGWAFAIPQGWCMKVYSRSGHGFKNGVSLVNSVGVIDSDYRGELMVGLRNDSPLRFDVKAGDRIAQAMLERADKINMTLVDKLPSTDRGAGGFGSTGA